MRACWCGGRRCRGRHEQRLWSGGADRLSLAVFEPVFRGELGDSLLGVAGDLGQRFLEEVEGIDVQTPAGLDGGEEDGAALPSFSRDLDVGDGQ